MNGIFKRCQTECSKPDGTKELNEEEAKDSLKPGVIKKDGYDASNGFFKYSSGDEDYVGDTKWKIELAWITKALEPAMQLCRWALPIGLLYVNSFTIILLAKLIAALSLFFTFFETPDQEYERLLPSMKFHSILSSN